MVGRTPPQTRNRKAGSGMVVCTICSLSCSGAESIKCASCSLSFHSKCVSIDEKMHEFFLVKGNLWSCIECNINKTNAFDKSLQEISEAATSIKESFNNFRQYVSTRIDKLEEIQRENTANIKELRAVQVEDKNNITSLQAVQTVNCSKICALESNFDSVKNSSDISKCVSEAEMKYQLKPCLLISGVPYAEEENLLAVIKAIGTEISVLITTADISDLFRLKKTDNIIVEFTRKLVRQQFFANYFKYCRAKKASSSTVPYFGGIMLLNFPNRIYINDVLSPSMYKVLRAARKLVKDNIIKLAGSRFGVVEIKLSEKNNWIKVSSIDHLNSLCSKSGGSENSPGGSRL